MSSISSTRLTGQSHGFTLLEVLVSTAILAVILVLLLGMTDGATRIWREGERKREVAREIHAGLQIISEDLRSAVLTTNPESLLIDHATRINGDEDPGEKIFFLVSHPSEMRHSGHKGDLCATGYFVAKAPEGDGVSNLYRFHASGREVAAALEANELGALYAKASASNVTSTELLARHIVKLEVHEPVGQPNRSNGVLLIALTGINGETARAIAADPEDTKRNNLLLHRNLQRLSGMVRLPPARETPGS
jgi:prepilin-type N-terminal cleavage/methylation domain-containing protein